MSCSNFFSNYQTNSEGFTNSTSYQLSDQILVMARHHHHYHHHQHQRVYHSQPLDLQLGLGLGLGMGLGPINLGHKRVSEIRSASTLLAPNRLLVDRNDLVPHQHQHQHLTPSFGSFAWGTQLPIYKNIDASPVRAGGRPIILGLGSDEDKEQSVDDGRLHSLETGVSGLYECPTCRIEFYSRFCYAAHVRIHHEKETRQERRMRLHNKYMSKMARRRRRLLRTWTQTPPTPTPTPTTNHLTSPSISVKLENQTE